jgi:hypothetical protein
VEPQHWDGNHQQTAETPALSRLTENQGFEDARATRARGLCWNQGTRRRNPQEPRESQSQVDEAAQGVKEIRGVWVQRCHRQSLPLLDVSGAGFPQGETQQQRVSPNRRGHALRRAGARLIPTNSKRPGFRLPNASEHKKACASLDLTHKLTQKRDREATASKSNRTGGKTRNRGGGGNRIEDFDSRSLSPFSNI